MHLEPTPAPSIEALLYNALMQGILPLTSQCNMKCNFCSNACNPKTCEVFVIPPRPLEEIEAQILWLVGSKGPIVIGESVTRINEGEPLTHPQFLEIIRLVHKQYPDRSIKITTNASLLTKDLIDDMAKLNVELMVSLNTINFREKVMGDTQSNLTLRNVENLGGRIKFEGSIVALPFITGWQDIEDTSSFLKESGAWSVRILSPGFSKLHPFADQVDADLLNQLKKLSTELTKKLKIPVLFEPSGITSVRPVVEYVLPGSPARRAGLRAEDVITEVSKRPVISRTEAFELIRDGERPRVSYDRHGVAYETIIKKRQFESSGLVMYDDLDTRAWYEWELKSRVKRRRVLIMTSAPAKPIIEDMLRQRNLNAKVKAVPSIFFGGNIEVAGLLTVRDFIFAYENSDLRDFDPDFVTLPQRSFDPWGRDLEGISYKTFEEGIGKPIVLG